MPGVTGPTGVPQIEEDGFEAARGRIRTTILDSSVRWPRADCFSGARIGSLRFCRRR